MKIITKNVAYVQKKDISFLLKSTVKVPEFLYLKLLEEADDMENKYEFVKFEDRDEIKFFKSMNWIIDYNDIKNSSEDDIIQMCKDAANEINAIADKFNAMPDKKKEKHEDMVQKCKLLEYKMHSLRDALWFKQGHINMSLPEITDYKKKSLLNMFKEKTDN